MCIKFTGKWYWLICGYFYEYDFISFSAAFQPYEGEAAVSCEFAADFDLLCVYSWHTCKNVQAKISKYTIIPFQAVQHNFPVITSVVSDSSKEAKHFANELSVGQYSYSGKITHKILLFRCCFIPSRWNFKYMYATLTMFSK